MAHERAAGSIEGHARALRSHAYALRALGQYDAAIRAYEGSEELFRSLDRDDEVMRTRIGRVTPLRYQGRYEEAVDLAMRTRAYFLARGDEVQAARLAWALGTVYRPMGRLADALRAYREARVVFRRLGEQSSLADIEGKLGNILVELGRYEEALRHMRAAERIRRRLGLTSEVALTLLNIGILCRRRGDYGRALQVLSEARQTYEAAGVERGARLVDVQLLPTCVALNLHEESRSAAARAIDGMRRFELPFELGQALLAAAALAELDNKLDDAGARIDEACEIFGRLGNRVWAALARLHRARLVLCADAGDEEQAATMQDGPGARADPSVHPGDHEGSPVLEGGSWVGTLESALADCREAIGAFEAAGALDHAALGRLIEAEILSRLADPTEALAHYDDVLRVAGALNADHLLYRAYASVGELLRTADPDAATDSYRRAINHLEAVRARPRG